MKHIVIVGGSFAGVSTAHRFLKNASKLTTAPYKVTLVSCDSHFYWNIASTRDLIPGQISDGKLFQPIAGGFSQYGFGTFKFVLDGKNTNIGYGYFVIATGSRPKFDGPFKSSGSTEAKKETLHHIQHRLKDAKSVVIVGAGPRGVETAGELAFEYGKAKKITLISSGPTVLENRPAGVSKAALKQLTALGADIQLNTKVREPVRLPNGKDELLLSGGEKLLVDLYIPTFGVLPNSSFVPSEFLDSQCFIKVNDYFAVEGGEGIFAIGDVNVEAIQLWFVEKHLIYIAKNLVAYVSGKPPLPYKASTNGMMGLRIGKKSATGHLGSWMVPGFLISIVRRTLFVEKLPKVVDGTGI